VARTFRQHPGEGFPVLILGAGHTVATGIKLCASFFLKTHILILAGKEKKGESKETS
jgi:hypothetical protein